MEIFLGRDFKWCEEPEVILVDASKRWNTEVNNAQLSSPSISVTASTLLWQSMSLGWGKGSIDDLSRAESSYLLYLAVQPVTYVCINHCLLWKDFFQYHISENSNMRWGGLPSEAHPCWIESGPLQTREWLTFGDMAARRLSISRYRQC